MDIPIAQTLLDLVLCIGMSLLIRLVYMHYSSSRASKVALSRVIPVISCATFLIIVIVKSSLALSLGLVGALSIVRFRTPIKEPEELTFIFLAIAGGLGYGASQASITTLLLMIILIFIVYFFGRDISENLSDSINCHLQFDGVDSLNKLVLSAQSIFGSSVLVVRKTIDESKVSLILAIDSNSIKLKLFENEILENKGVVKCDLITSKNGFY